MKHAGWNWYDLIPARERAVVDAAATWLRPVAWQFFVTLTFPWNPRPETAVLKLRQFANALEKHYGCNLCFVAGQESKPRQHGISIPTHFHLLLTAHRRLTKDDIEAIWLAQVTHRPAQGRNEESVRVEPYSAHERGPEYCLKTICESGDWHIHRLEHFHPAASSRRRDHHSIRSAKRNNEQAARLAPTFDAL